MNSFRMQIEFTNHCNFRCRMCPHAKWREGAGGAGNPYDREEGFISEEVFELARENARRHARIVSLGFFGEQMLHPRFREFVERLRDRRYELVLFTNWSLFTRHHVEALRSVDRIQISLDSTDGPTWETLCPGGAVLDLDGHPAADRYAALVDKIEYWLALRDRPATGLECVISSVNPEDRERVPRRWLSRLSAKDSVLTKSVLSYGGVMSDGMIVPNACLVPDQDRFTVAWDGRCTPCNLDVNLALAAGNLLETRDMAEIAASQAWRERLSEIRGKKGICARCIDANNHSQVIHRPPTWKDRWLPAWLRRSLRRVIPYR